MTLELRTGCTRGPLTTDTFEILLCWASEHTSDFQRRNSVISFPPFSLFPAIPHCRDVQHAGFSVSRFLFTSFSTGQLRVPRCYLWLWHHPSRWTAELRPFYSKSAAAFYKNRKPAAAFIGEDEGFSLLFTSTSSWGSSGWILGENMKAEGGLAGLNFIFQPPAECRSTPNVFIITYDLHGCCVGKHCAEYRRKKRPWLTGSGCSLSKYFNLFFF